MASESNTSERQSFFGPEDVHLLGTGEMYGPDAPKLPLPNMLMLTRITEVSETGGHYGRGQVIAELDIDPDLWFFQCHFRDDPVMPGCLGLDAMWQLCGFYLAWSGHLGLGRALGVGEVKFSGQVLPTVKKVTYHIHIKRVIARKLVMAIADGVLAADDEPIYHAKQLRVGVFSSTNAPD